SLTRAARPPLTRYKCGDSARKGYPPSLPSLAIRVIESGGYSLASALANEHVRVQQILAPGETRELAAELAPGPYRLRTVEAGGEVELHPEGGAFPGVTPAVSQVPRGEAAPPGPPRPPNAGEVE